MVSIRNSFLTRFALATLFLLARPVFADPPWLKLADRVQQAYEGIQDLQMEFEQSTYVALLEKEVQKQGSIKLKKPGKFSIQYSGARGSRYLSNRAKLWVFKEGDTKPQTFNADDRNIPAEALSFLCGLGTLKRDFAVEEVEPKKREILKLDPSRQWMELTPLKKLSQIDWMVMGFDVQDATARELYLATESGNLTHYRFSALVKNANLSDALFEFQKP